MLSCNDENFFDKYDRLSDDEMIIDGDGNGMTKAEMEEIFNNYNSCANEVTFDCNISDIIDETQLEIKAEIKKFIITKVIPQTGLSALGLMLGADPKTMMDLKETAVSGAHMCYENMDYLRYSMKKHIQDVINVQRGSDYDHNCKHEVVIERKLSESEINPYDEIRVGDNARVVIDENNQATLKTMENHSDIKCSDDRVFLEDIREKKVNNANGEYNSDIEDDLIKLYSYKTIDGLEPGNIDMTPKTSVFWDGSRGNSRLFLSEDNKDYQIFSEISEKYNQYGV